MLVLLLAQISVKKSSKSTDPGRSGSQGSRTRNWCRNPSWSAEGGWWSCTNCRPEVSHPGRSSGENTETNSSWRYGDDKERWTWMDMDIDLQYTSWISLHSAQICPCLIIVGVSTASLNGTLLQYAETHRLLSIPWSWKWGSYLQNAKTQKSRYETSWVTKVEF